MAGAAAFSRASELAEFRRVALKSPPEALRLAAWLIRESARRRGLRPEDYCGTYFLSYPRSGSHAARFVVEFLSGRPTLGAGDHESIEIPKGFSDVPICVRSKRIKLSTYAPPPIAVKRHFIRPFDKVKKLVFIHRDPVEAILSHVNQSGSATTEDLLGEVNKWQSTLEVFEGHPESSRHMLLFENILNNDSSWVGRLATFLELDVTVEQSAEAGSFVSEARMVLARAPKTVHARTYRDQYPAEAKLLDDAFMA